MEATPRFELGVKALQASALPLGHVADEKGRFCNRPQTCDGADNGARTRDPNLGKVVLYQLSHVRLRGITIRDSSCLCKDFFENIAQVYREVPAGVLFALVTRIFA